MRTLLSILACCLLLIIGVPAIAQAATPYFSVNGQSSLDGALSHDFVVGESGRVDITLMNRGPARWLLASGRFPSGLAITTGSSMTGDASRSVTAIAGTPTEEGTFPVRLFAITSGDSYALDFTINTYIRTLAIEPVGVAQGRVGLTYSQPLTATGSISIAPSLYWGITEGALPPGLSLHTQTGVISGTPTVAGTYNYTVRMNELAGRMRAATPRAYLHTIQTASTVTSPVRITTRTNPVDGRVGTTYPAQLFRAEGGSGGYRWAITSGALPPGITLDGATGILSGTPTTAGSYNAALKAYDLASELNSDVLSFTLVVQSSGSSIITPPSVTTISPLTPTVTPIPSAAGSLAISTTSLPNGSVGSSYSTTLAASGGTGAYSWNFASGVLPPGVSLSDSGALSGTPTTAGTYTFYIEVFDAARTFVGRTYTVSIASAGTAPAPTPTSGTGTGTTGTGTSLGSGSATSPETATRLANLARINVNIHALVKLPDDGNRFTQEDSAVYYIGADGRRHAFPNDRVFSSWYSNFDSVRVVQAANLASIPLGANVTYKPGVKMVKFTTDPKVYVVANNRSLRWVMSETVAIALYGTNWNRQIDDISDTYYTDYMFGSDVSTATSYDRVGLMSSIRYVSDVLPL